ncbi:MAG: type II toxin-antitoxin system HicB family antitoxin [Chloroflexi bacterium]|nr:type II toxin-antitoxin system HicB family antitoxin [Chloroflexota bacterium]MBM3154077.1 type II toxin-antitoxin system HicB family antitoxin [Chloroflexota bacterium]MBM3173626.1 type II toxin-antitoxin system HicB family antitoxin [Chloroflexota bacterium]MBM3175347.1 type II toxin-antitoxin system HicB family antitoxin [Chloroflexota bacterium]MBM4450721.1 type II toxin-antitoxin system HicB family antitoxin [Chloroflexota bacterium]
MPGNGHPTIEFQVNIVVEPDKDGFHAFCPALKGLHACGDTEHEALSNARDAAIAYIQSLIKHGDPIPVGIIVDESQETKRAQSRRKTPHRHYTEALTVATT